MKNILTILLLVFLTGCSGTGYNDWTEQEQTKYKYFLGLQAVDSLQTYEGLKCNGDKSFDCIEEINPLYGKNPSLEKIIGLKLVSNLLIYNVLVNDVDSFDRELALNIMNTGYTLVIINNQIVINRSF